MDTSGTGDFQERAEEAKALLEAQVAEAKAEQAAKEIASDTAEIPRPFDWKVAFWKSVYPFLSGIATAAALAGLDWLLSTDDWKTKVAPWLVPSVIAAATYAKNYRKQQAKMAKLDKE